MIDANYTTMNEKLYDSLVETWISVIITWNDGRCVEAYFLQLLEVLLILQYPVSGGYEVQ